ncbi:hypothetical protein GGI25_001179 [Coemansia spiralis]|uniref:RSE1/DDB1/CPSF1 C-terminal domain-containing protein n=2 Tax=Coemansia TaxID=4863 RepID=A0A9W8G5X1_9FUNG|nr:hypothetical protein EDC05_006113 [Coemansia umbellata]KAJ2624686.1 hypothetical protein GGI26_001380 [Coemansia sp. RSA 1358]KAJ2679728.1 hypothetical protein GGI25_001179 [Coemansia spiralis]
MSAFSIYPTAWNAADSNGRDVRAYIKQTLNSGMINCAVQGYFRYGRVNCSKDIVAVIGSSLVLLDISMKLISETPIYANVVSLDVLSIRCAPGQSAKTDEARDMCVVLTEDCRIILVYVEVIDCRYRFRLADELKTEFDNQISNFAPHTVRKIVKDPCSRAIGLISWLNHIELLIIDWNSVEGSQQIISPLHHCVGFKTKISGAICDAAILVPSVLDSQRVLLIAAIATQKPQRQFYLSLYETWSSTCAESEEPLLKLVANLPLPLSTTTPLHIVPLSAFPECLLLITEDEIMFVSMLQIISGDVFLHRVPLPAARDSKPDLVCAFSVAGIVDMAGMAVPRSPAVDRGSAHLAQPLLAQKVYLTTQSGLLYRICASSKPLIELTEVTANKDSTGSAELQGYPAGGTLLHLGCRESSESSVDTLFASGDCADSTIIRVCETLAETDEGPVKSIYMQQTVPILTNHCPMTDFVLRSDMVYWTAGRMATGSVHQAQFGHAVQAEYTAELGVCSSNSDEVQGMTELWPLNCDRPGSLSGVVLFQQGTGTFVTEDEMGNWRVVDALQQYVSDPALLSINCFCISDTISKDRLLRILKHGIDVVDIDMDNGIESPNITAISLISAQKGEVFIHSTYCNTTTSYNWVAVAAQNSPGSSCARIFAIPNSSTGLETQQLIKHTIDFDHEISCLRLFTFGTTSLLLVGTYDLKLHMYRLKAKSAPKLDLSLDIALYMKPTICSPDEDRINEDSMSIDGGTVNSLQTSSHWIPNDVYILCSSTSMHILIGLRDGHILLVSVDGQFSTSTNLLSERQLRALSVIKTMAGQMPVSFGCFPATNVDGGKYKSANDGCVLRTVILTDSLYIACLEEIGMVKISPCFGNDVPFNSINRLVPLTGNGFQTETLAQLTNDDGATDSQRYFVIHGNSSASVLNIAIKPQCHLAEFAIGGEPRHIIIDEETDMMLVAGVLARDFSTTSVLPTSYLRVLDPINVKMHAEIRFHPFELVHSLVTWYIQGQKRYRYICVGTGLYVESAIGQNVPGASCSQPRGGRLIIYNLKTQKRKGRAKTASSPRQEAGCSAALDQAVAGSGYELKYVWESERKGPVLALAPLGDSYLIVAAGRACIVLKLDVIQRQLIECCEVLLRFPVTSLDICGYDIVAGSQREAISVLRFTPASDGNDHDKLVLLHSTRFGANTVDAQFMSKDIVVGVDNLGFLYAVGIPDTNTEFGLDVIFSMHLGTECTRLQRGRLVGCLYRPNHVLSWSDNETMATKDESFHTEKMQSEDSIIVSTVSGALWTLIRISNQAFSLLKELERTMVAFSSEHPARPLLLAVENSIDRARQSPSLPNSNVIDGTLATMFLEGLTKAEQQQVVDSSLRLQQLALALYKADARDSHGSEPDIVQIISKLVWGLNCVCTC